VATGRDAFLDMAVPVALFADRRRYGHLHLTLESPGEQRNRLENSRSIRSVGLDFFDGPNGQALDPDPAQLLRIRIAQMSGLRRKFDTIIADG
jgi:hypothetical protein